MAARILCERGCEEDKGGNEISGWAKASGVGRRNTKRLTARSVYDTGIDGKRDEERKKAADAVASKR
jgi:hypothetical protein